MVVSNKSLDIKKCRLKIFNRFFTFFIFFHFFFFFLILPPFFFFAGFSFFVARSGMKRVRTQRNVTQVQLSIGFISFFFFFYFGGRWMGKIVRFMRVMWNPGHVSVRVRVFGRVSRAGGTLKFGSFPLPQFHTRSSFLSLFFFFLFLYISIYMCVYIYTHTHTHTHTRTHARTHTHTHTHIYINLTSVISPRFERATVRSVVMRSTRRTFDRVK